MTITADDVLLASEIIDLGKKLARDRFPATVDEKEDTKVATAWAGSLKRAFDSLPREIWPEAVAVWGSELVSDRMATAKEIKQAAYIVRDRWERIPERARMLQARREYNERLRDQQISDGSFGEVRGFVSPKMLQEPTRRSTAPDNVRAAWREVMRNVSRVS